MRLSLRHVYLFFAPSPRSAYFWCVNKPAKFNHAVRSRKSKLINNTKTNPANTEIFPEVATPAAVAATPQD
jgi:hypothetical protein